MIRPCYAQIIDDLRYLAIGKSLRLSSYSTLMRRLSGILALGTTMLRMPFFKEALTASWSTLAWKVKLRSNWPTLRSEIQYCDLGASVFGASLAGSEAGTASADDSAAAEA